MNQITTKTDAWARAFPNREKVWIDAGDGEGTVSLVLSVDQAVQLSRMIVKAAAEAAGLETASEALSGADPTGDTRTP